MLQAAIGILGIGITILLVGILFARKTARKSQTTTMVPYAGPERRVAQVPLDAREEDLRVVAFRYPAKA